MIKSLKSLNNVKEHIILDWSSDEEVKLNVENTKVLRIETNLTTGLQELIIF